MRTRGILTVLASLLCCPVLHAESSTAPSDKSGASTGVVAASRPNQKGAMAEGPVGNGTCTLAGVAAPNLDLEITDADGRAVARFGGVPIPLTLSELPEQGEGRVRVTTGGVGRLRLSGFVAVRAIPMYLKQDVPIIKGRVTLLKGTAVEYVGRSGSDLLVRVNPTSALSDTFAAAVGCESLSIERQRANPWAPPGHARAYLMRQSAVQLFDQPAHEAKPTLTLHLAPDARAILLFGDRREGDFVHVLYRREIGIDGWMSAEHLQIVPRGELMDHPASRYTPPTDKRLQMKVEGQLYRANAEIPLYGRADPKLAPIGTVTKDTELYVLDVMVGWANVLPRHLDVVPIGERHFWVKASELGL